jgi:hypothetical protein
VHGKLVFVTKSHHPITKKFSFASDLHKFVFLHFYIGVGMKQKLQKGSNKSPVKLWRAKVPFSTIRSQLKMSKLTRGGSWLLQRTALSAHDF